MTAASLTDMSISERLLTNVADLIDHPGATKRVHVAREVPGLRVEMAHVVEDGGVSVDVRLDSIVEGIHASGEVSGEMAFECRRCLGEFRRHLEVHLDEIYEFAPGEEGGYRVEGEMIDLEPMVRDAVMLALPLNPLCREECKGLCPQCGQDLNSADCGHDRTPGKVRWEPLRKLMEGMEE